MFCLWKNFDQNFFQFFLTPSKCSTKNWTWFFPYFSFEKFSFFWQNFFSAKSLFFLCFPFKFFFRPTKKNIFFTLQMQIFTIFCLIIFLLFFLIFADRPPKSAQRTPFTHQTWLYRNLNILLRSLALNMSFSLIQEAEGFSLTTQFIESKKIVSVTPQNPKFSPKTNLEVGCEVRDRLLELFIKIAVFCRTWFFKNLVNF